MQIYFMDFQGDHHFHSTITERSLKRKALKRLKREIVASTKVMNKDSQD